MEAPEESTATPVVEDDVELVDEEEAAETEDTSDPQADSTRDQPTFSGCPDITLWGDGVAVKHCKLEYLLSEDVVTLIPGDGICYINGQVVETATALAQGNMVQLGEENVFRFNHPTQAAKMRMQAALGLSSSASGTHTPMSNLSRRSGAGGAGGAGNASFMSPMRIATQQVGKYWLILLL